jgi:glycine hydroxymethyltransferase
MRAISDGYVLFDDEDVWRKVRGPAKVDVISETSPSERTAAFAVRGPRAQVLLSESLDKPGISDLGVYSGIEAGYDGHRVLIAGDSYGKGETWYSVYGPATVLQQLWAALEEAGGQATPAPDARHALRRAAVLPASWSDSTAERDASPYVNTHPELFSLDKPYFVGQHKLPLPDVEGEKEAFAWATPRNVALKRTPLYEEHVRLGAKIVSFAGWEMPVWYTRVSEEHQAVREAAGLFDVAHMGTLGVCGPHAADFLDLVTVNYVRWLEDGDSQYSAFLDPSGHILDDVIVYRRAWDRYFVVVNAANFDKDWAWLNAVNRNKVIVDLDRPWVNVLHSVELHDLRHPESGVEQRVDIALQGPNSLAILLACTTEPTQRTALRRLGRTQFVEMQIEGMNLLVSRTGYTGEEMGFELYVHPDHAVALWHMLLERGAPLGLMPCGLAARDSLRIEAGLPLYGHELGGNLDITQSEAGFGAYVKYHKPFFIGRTPYRRYDEGRKRQIVRFAIDEQGVRPIRGGDHGEPVVNRRGKVTGTVTSCAIIGERQIGMALVEERYAEVGSELFIYPEARKAVGKAPAEFAVGDAVALPVRATILPRFPQR